MIRGFYLLLGYLFFSCSSKNSSGGGTPPPPPNPATYDWSFDSAPVWSDEFSTDGLPDAAKWGYDIGGNGWGNNELQYYTDGLNAYITGGILKITARKESFSGKDYTSARMITKNKGDWLYGRFEIRAKLPKGRGTWPALWTLPTDWAYGNWPNSGEIDIMELIGTYPNRVHGTLHWKPVNGTNVNKGGYYELPTGDFSQKFHVFSIIWTQDMIKWYVDDIHFLTLSKAADFGTANYPFNAPEFFIFNVAVGGNWPGPPDANTTFPQRMFVDYVRVFQ